MFHKKTNFLPLCKTENVKCEKMALTQNMKKLIKSCLNPKIKRQKWKFFAPECQNVKMAQGNGTTQSLNWNSKEKQNDKQSEFPKLKIFVTYRQIRILLNNYLWDKIVTTNKNHWIIPI